MEKRIRAGKGSKKGPKSSLLALPKDFLSMVQEVLANHFEEPLMAISKIKPNPKFEATGRLYPDEILIGVSLVNDDPMSCTTVYSSVDFDPAASAPKAEDLLSDMLDGVAAVFHHLLNPENPKDLEKLIGGALASLENIPFEWSEIEINKRSIWVKVDKANPRMDEMATEWLAKNDPEGAPPDEEDTDEEGDDDDDGSRTLH